MVNVRIILLFMLFLASSSAFSANAKKEVKKGNLLYNKGQFSSALKHYNQALEEMPDSDIVNFNLGAALYKKEEYGQAIGHFEKSLVSLDENLEQSAHYNIANSKYKSAIGNEDADLPGAVNLLKEALYHYEKALDMDPDDSDSKYNYDFVKEELKRLKEKLEEQEQENKQCPLDKKGQEEPQKKENGTEETSQEESSQEEESQSEKEELQGEESENSQEDLSQREAQETSSEEMSEKEAMMLLESYRQEEEPRGFYKKVLPDKKSYKVLKDW